MESHISFKKIFLISLIVSLSISALLGIIIFLVGNFGQIEFKILLTTLAIGGFSLTSLCCATLLDKKRASAFAVIGMIISILGFLFTVCIIWNSNFQKLIILKSMIIMIILAFSTAHASLLLLIKSNKTIVNVSLATTLFFISLVALESIIITIDGALPQDAIWFRILGVFAILDVLGTIIIPILLKITSLHDQEKASR